MYFVRLVLLLNGITRTVTLKIFPFKTLNDKSGAGQIDMYANCSIEPMGYCLHNRIMRIFIIIIIIIIIIIYCYQESTLSKSQLLDNQYSL